MSYSFNLLSGTPEQRQIALVRNETEDVSGSNAQDGGVIGTDYVFTDERILAFLESAREEAPQDANDAEVRLFACGKVLDALATNQAFILKKQRTLHEETDGAAVAKEIRAHAASCRASANGLIADRRKQAALGDAEAERTANRPVRPRGGGVRICPTL
jgi:hypothetical protein